MCLPNLTEKGVFLSKCMSVSENKTKPKSKQQKKGVSTVLETLSFLTENVT